MFAVVLKRAGLVAVQFLVSASEVSMVEGYEVCAHALLGQSSVTEQRWRLTLGHLMSLTGDGRGCWLAFG